MRCGGGVTGNWVRIFWRSSDDHVGAAVIIRKPPDAVATRTNDGEVWVPKHSQQ